MYFSAEVPQRAEGERPELCDRQRWEAVFRRERRPEVSTASYSSCAGSGTGCGLFAEALYGFCCFRRFGKEPCLMKKNLCEKAGVGRHAVRSVRGGQRIQLPHVRQQMCTHPAHGQCDLRGAAWPVVGRGRGLCGLAAAQPAGSGQPDGFPGSMFGALLCGLVYHKTKNILATMVGEVFGTSILGGLCAYPVAIFLMGKSAGDIAFYAYIVPFLISTAVGSIIAGVLVYSLQRSGALRSMQNSLS